MRHSLLGLSVLVCFAAGCKPIETHNTVVIEQPKPLEININLSGRLELVITDARQDLQSITGEKPKREVKPEDIGLPATGSPGAMLPVSEEAGVTMLVSFPGAADAGTTALAATEDELVKSMAERNTKVRALMSAHVAGEAHTGLLVERGTLSAEQAATLAAENADRTALYKLRAAQKKITEADAALAYYLQRLGYVEKGDWVEKFNKTTKKWEWVQWQG